MEGLGVAALGRCVKVRQARSKIRSQMSDGLSTPARLNLPTTNCAAVQFGPSSAASGRLHDAATRVEARRR
jgi:hypothetical protein